MHALFQMENKWDNPNRKVTEKRYKSFSGIHNGFFEISWFKAEVKYWKLGNCLF